MKKSSTANEKKIFQMKMTKRVKMNIKIVPNGHKNSLNEQKIVHMDIKIVQMK